MAYYSQHRRSYLFNDITGNLWNQLLSRCCDIIDGITTDIIHIQKPEIILNNSKCMIIEIFIYNILKVFKQKVINKMGYFWFFLPEK